MQNDRRKPRPRGNAANPFPSKDDRAPTAYLHRRPARPQRPGGSGRAHGHPSGGQQQRQGGPSHSRLPSRSGPGARPAPLPQPVASGPRMPEPSAHVGNIEPFELFCAYHLGITERKSYTPANIHDVARRFRVDPSVIKQALQAYGMDPDAILNTEFDITMAQLDIQVAPEGIDRVELAKGIYEDFRRAPRKARDWRRVLEEDAKENAKIFGKR